MTGKRRPPPESEQDDSPRSSGRHSPASGGRGEPVSGGEPGTVLETVGGVYRVRLDRGDEVDAFLRGRLKRIVRTGDKVVPGDRVAVRSGDGDDGTTIEAVFDRENELARAGPGGRKPKVVAANLDRCLVVLAALAPPLRPEVADRFLVLSESCGIPPTLVLNKVDLPGAREAVAESVAVYRNIGYEVICTSAETGEGGERLAKLLSSGISALVGPSGVGKSSLLNRLDPGLTLRTAPVSRRGGLGRHTTVSSRLLPVAGGGWVADTPGFSDTGLWEVDPAELPAAFPEFREPSEHCRFRGCTHTHEPECGVKEALEAGAVPRVRYESYLAMSEGKREW